MTSFADQWRSEPITGLRRGMARREAAWRAVAVTLALYSLAFVVFAIGPFEVPERLRSMIGDLAFVPAGITVAALALNAARRPGAPESVRQAWLLLGLSFVLFWAGDVIYAVLELLAEDAPGTSPADLAYLAYYPIALVGLLSFPRVLASQGDRARFVLDAATVALGGALVVWYFVLGPLVSADHSDILDTLLSIAYPVGDLVILLGVAVIAIRRPNAVPGRAISLLLAGMVVSLAADIAFGAQTIDGTVQSGGAVDALYMIAWAILGASAHVAATRPMGKRPVVEPVDMAPASVPVLPYLSAALGYGMLIVAVRDTWSPTVLGLIVGAGALTGLVIVRQVLTVREHTALIMAHVARRYEARFRSLVQDASDIILVVGEDLAIRYASPSAGRAFGTQTDTLLGGPLLERVAATDRPAVERLLADAVAAGGATVTDELRLARDDGTTLMVEASIRNLLDDPEVRGHVLMIRDIDARKRLEVKLAQQAFHHSLTGLPERALFMGEVGRAMTAAHGTASQVGVLYLGLDDLGTVNDSLGHQAGDRMLKEAANRIRKAVGSLGPVGHIAGDEFAVLLAGPTSMDVLRHASERLLATFNEPFVLGGVEVVPGASIGMAVSGPSDTREEVLRNAGMAMALAKANGKRRCEAYTADMEGVARNRLDVVAALRHGLERAEFEVHYQPIVDLTHGGPIGAEALIRWRRPNVGLVPPNAFIPIAEESGLIGPIGAWVLEQACLTAAAWPRSTVSMAPSVAVNVSARQLDDLGFADVVANALRRADLAPARLVLEVTESLMMTNPELLVERLRALKRLGVQIAIDDFGTGYSSLSYLRRLPVDKVKIDRSFVSDLDRSTGFALVRGIIEMTRSLGLASIAEGIETPEQAATLAAFGCDNGQGFLFGRAVPAANIGHLLSAPFPSHPFLANPPAQPTAA